MNPQYNKLSEIEQDYKVVKALCRDLEVAKIEQERQVENFFSRLLTNTLEAFIHKHGYSFFDKCMAFPNAHEASKDLTCGLVLDAALKEICSCEKMEVL